METWKEIFRLRRAKAKEKVEKVASASGLLTLKQAADYLGISPLTIYGWTSKRKIPFRKVGRLLRFDKNEIDIWTQREVKKAQDPSV